MIIINLMMTNKLYICINLHSLGKLNFINQNTIFSYYTLIKLNKTHLYNTSFSNTFSMCIQDNLFLISTKKNTKAILGEIINYLNQSKMVDKCNVCKL